jgi:YbbR domain-containing protein
MAWRPFRNFGLKLVALGLGTLLWFTVSSQQLERSIRVPVEYRNVPDSLELTGDQTESVYVHLRGPDNIISRLEPGDVRAVLDMAQATAVGHGTFPLRTDQVVSPPGAEVMWIEPSEVSLSLETMGAATVAVEPNVTGVPAAGYARGAITVTPATVDVLGPADQVKALHAVSTNPISIDGATTAVTATVGIEVPNAALRMKVFQRASVTIAIVRGGGGR